MLKLRLGDLRGTKGITHQTKIEIRDAKRKWAERFPGIEEQDLPSLPAGGVTQLSTVGNGPLGEFSIDHCLERIEEGDGDDSRAQAYKLALLGLGPVPSSPSFPWPSQTAVARHYQIAGPTVNVSYGKICGRWKTKSGTIKGLRDTIDAILRLQSGVMSAIELADALLAQRGCRDQDSPTRRKKSLAVLKAALDVEADFQEPRFILYRGHHTPIIARTSELGQYADRLGDLADELVATLPPASPAKAMERLRAIPVPGDLLLDDRRALALATAASSKASLSPNRLELYPKGMPAIEALKLASGALAGLDAIPVRELHQRVRDRYPDAELLPDRPGLDRLIERAELGLVWDGNLAPDPALPDNKGAYTRRSANLPTASGFSLLSTSRGHGTRATRTEDQEEAEACTQRLASSRSSRGFAALQVLIDWAILAESALRTAFPDLAVVDLEANLLSALKDNAAQLKIPWSTVVSADAAKPGTTDAQNLRRLVKESLKPLATRLRSSPAPLLLTNPGLLARYDHISLLTDLRDAAGTVSGPPGVWVLVPTGSFGSHPTIDGAAIPIIGSHQTLVLPRSWIALQKPQAA